MARWVTLDAPIKVSMEDLGRKTEEHEVDFEVESISVNSDGHIFVHYFFTWFDEENVDIRSNYFALVEHCSQRVKEMVARELSK